VTLYVECVKEAAAKAGYLQALSTNKDIERRERFFMQPLDRNQLSDPSQSVTL